MASSVDHAEIKLGQLLTIIISVTALMSGDTRPLVALAVIFLLSGTVRSMSPFSLLYRYVVNPLGMMRSDYRLDNIQPHKFGQLIGVLTLVIALGLIESGFATAGWAVVVLLVVLTLVSYLGWCIGCYLYYQLHRLGLGGFFSRAPTDTSVIPGQRPGKSVE